MVMEFSRFREMVQKRKVKTLKIFMLKQLGKVVLRSVIDAEYWV